MLSKGRALMTRLSSFGLPFGEQQRLQLTQYVGGIDYKITSLFWIGGEIVQLVDEASNRTHRRSFYFVILVIVVKFPDLFGTTGARWKCCDYRLDVRRLLDSLIRLTCKKVELMRTTAYIVFSHEINWLGHFGL